MKYLYLIIRHFFPKKKVCFHKWKTDYVSRRNDGLVVQQWLKCEKCGDVISKVF